MASDNRAYRPRIAKACVCCGSADIAASPAILMPFIAHRAFGWAPVTIDESWGLRTIPQGQALSICKTLHCRACGHLFCDIRFDDAEMAALYAGYREEDYVALREHYEPGYRARNAGLAEIVSYKPGIEAFLAPYVPERPAILDWGGDTGANTPYEGRRTVLDIYDISGVEVIPGARAVTPEQAARGRYDLVICGQVLEHTPWPGDVLAGIRAAMCADTVLYIEVPFEAVMQGPAEALPTAKRHWHEHVNFYAQSSLAALVRGAGFELLDSAVLEIEIAGSHARILQAACRLA